MSRSPEEQKNIEFTDPVEQWVALKNEIIKIVNDFNRDLANASGLSYIRTRIPRIDFPSDQALDTEQGKREFCRSMLDLQRLVEYFHEAIFGFIGYKPGSTTEQFTEDDFTYANRFADLLPSEHLQRLSNECKGRPDDFYLDKFRLALESIFKEYLEPESKNKLFDSAEHKKLRAAKICRELAGLKYTDSDYEKKLITLGAAIFSTYVWEGDNSSERETVELLFNNIGRINSSLLPSDSGHEDFFRNKGHLKYYLKNWLRRDGLQHALEGLGITDAEIDAKKNDWRISRKIAEPLAPTESRNALLNVVTNYLKTKKATPNDPGFVRADHFKKALESIKPEDPEFKRKLYELVYLMTFSYPDGSRAGEFKDRVLATLELTESQLKADVEDKANARLFGHLFYNPDDRKPLLKLQIVTAHADNIFKQDVVPSATAQSVELTAALLEARIKTYKPDTDLGRSRVNNLLAEIEKIKRLPDVEQQKQQLLILQCAVVFKTSSKDLRDKVLGITGIFSFGLGDAKEKLKAQQNAAGISDYEIWQKVCEINAPVKVPDWAELKKQVLGAIDSFCRSSVDVVPALVAEQKIRALLDGNLTHENQYQLLLIVKAMMLQSHIPELKNTILSFISQSGLNEDLLKKLELQYGMVDEQMPALQKNVENNQSISFRERQIKLIAGVELFLMGSNDPNKQQDAVKLLSDLEKPDVTALQLEVLTADFRKRNELPSIPKEVIRDSLDEFDLADDDDLVVRRVDLGVESTVTNIPKNSDDGVEMQVRSASAVAPAAASVVAEAPELETIPVRTKLFEDLKTKLLNCVNVDPIRATKFKDALKRVDVSDEKGKKRLIILASEMSAGSDQFSRKVLHFAGMTSKEMNMLRHELKIDETPQKAQGAFPPSAAALAKLGVFTPPPSASPAQEVELQRVNPKNARS